MPEDNEPLLASSGSGVVWNRVRSSRFTRPVFYIWRTVSQPKFYWFYWLLLGFILGYYSQMPIRYATLAWSMYWRTHRPPSTHVHKPATLAMGSSGGSPATAVTAGTSEVNEGQCVAGINPTLDRQAFTVSSSQLQLFLNFSIPCDGEIVSWRYLQEEPILADRSVHILIGRIDDDKLILDGINTIVTTTSTDWTEFAVESGKRVPVTKVNFIAIAYDSTSDQPVIPLIDNSSPKKTELKQSLSDGIEIDFDKSQVDLMLEVGRPFPTTVSDILKSGGFQISKSWRLPALQAIIQ